MPKATAIYMDNVTAIFVPVRLSSTRLPLKAMRRIQDKPCIQLLVERVKRSRRIDLIVLCTTLHKNDDELVNVAKRLDIACFRGSDVDILERYRQAATKHNVKQIVNVDGDDIFCEPSFIDLTAEKLADADCVLWQDVPLGSSPVGIRTSALEKICSIKDVSNTETGWTRFFTETGLFNVVRLRPDNPELRDPNIRLTLDYEQDFRLFEKIYENLKEPFDLADIVRLLRAKPELAKINENLKDTYMKNFNSKAVRVKLKKQYEVRDKPDG
jgi:spore coat polysaccharide biosynthesis protein SpsF